VGAGLKSKGDLLARSFLETLEAGGCGGCVGRRLVGCGLVGCGLVGGGRYSLRAESVCEIIVCDVVAL
jgi:hypothetical protein